MVENKDKITVEEFKAWLVGLIRGKNGNIPNLDDWKQIKIMLDKIKPEKIVVEKERNPFQPYLPSYPYRWHITETTDKETKLNNYSSAYDEYKFMNNETFSTVGTSISKDKINESTLDINTLDKIFSDWI